MEKENVYVPIANKKEAKRAKAVLEAMGEVIDERYFKSSYDENEGGLYFNEKYKTWVIAISFRHSYNVRTKTTLKQLIELLVSEHNQAEPEKIAVRVDNEKEFNALMKYYDGLGWKNAIDTNALDCLPIIKNGSGFPCIVEFNNWFHSYGAEKEDYKIIPFSDFAKEHGIRVPLLVSEDGVDLYQQDVYHCVKNLHNKGWKYCFENQLYPSHFVITDSEVCKAFSTKQAALDWIEEQKPKSIEVKISQGEQCIISKRDVDFPGLKLLLTIKDMERIRKAMDELNS